MKGKIQITDWILKSDLGPYIKKLKNGVYDWEVKRWNKNRSSDQNAYYRFVLQLLSEHTGYEDDEMHEIVKAKFLTEKIKLRWDKRKNISIARSTTTLSTVEFEDLMTKIRQWGAIEFGMNIPKPNEAPSWTENIPLL